MHQRSLIICDTENDEEKESQYLKYCEGIRTRGIILTEGHKRDTFHKIARNQKIVIMDRSRDTDDFSVSSDSRKGILMIVKYLHELGHRNIGFAGCADNIHTAMERKKAFIDAQSDTGISVPEENILYGSLTPSTGVEAFDYFNAIKNKPTAIVCCNDQVATGFIMRAYSKNIRIPQEFSVTGFDGYMPDYFTPKITTIKQDIPTIAKKLYSAVFSEDEEPEHIIIPVTLAIGDSCKKIRP